MIWKYLRVTCAQRRETRMDSRLNSKLYIADIQTIIKTLDIRSLNGKSIMISGATGMIGTFLIDLIMYHNANENGNIRIIALGRNKEKGKARFSEYLDSSLFSFIECDITKPIVADIESDYIIHAASTTHPLAYSTEPIGTITSNVLGTINLLEYGIKHNLKRFVYVSSVEVYGENQGDTDRFDESYCGYINCNTLRAGYSESKRLCEALCQAYRKEKNTEIVIPRLARSFGPTMQMSDSKAIAQFIKKGLAKEDIVLKSKGDQLYTYTYTPDAVSGILACLLNGLDGEAYNIASEENEITLKNLAEMIATNCGVRVVYDIPDEIEKAGYSTATKATMTSDKIRTTMKWKTKFSINNGITRTLNVLKLAKISV